MSGTRNSGGGVAREGREGGRAISGGRRRREGKAARKAARLAVGGGGVAIWVRGRVRPRSGDNKKKIGQKYFFNGVLWFGQALRSCGSK